ncbi:VOC family protein [Cohnella nanjingensis]|uniref:VOC family protein n=1 Tax=Cohnella nanjingensis TaxID=1387779 RepID=A0A7X0RP01_9BACL|nr:VOC family protein [Cohnella nanjingensis]MBB6671058.1 VOC family protein [Cohnella nanjingensis]
MFDRIDRVFLPVRSAAAAEAWYAGEFEFQVAERRGRETDLRIGDGEALLTLIETAPHAPLGFLHEGGHVPCYNFYTHWEDLHADWLHARGVRTTEAMNVPYMNVCEMFDPDGNAIGICHEKAESLYHTRHDGALPPMFHRVLAVFIPVRDLDASIRWYVETLGFTLHHHWGQGADLKVGDGETIATMIVMDPDVHRGALRTAGESPYYSLRTPDLGSAYRTLRERGVAAERREAEPGGLLRFHVRSPEGVVIRVTEQSPALVTAG